MSSIDWQKVTRYTNKIADLVIMECDEFTSKTPFEVEVMVMTHPPRIVLKFYTRSQDNRRSERYSEYGRQTVLSDSEKINIGDFVGTLINRYNLRCNKGYCPQGSQLNYYIKPKYEDWRLP